MGKLKDAIKNIKEPRSIEQHMIDVINTERSIYNLYPLTLEEARKWVENLSWNHTLSEHIYFEAESKGLVTEF
jgi:hypothetical protein